MPKAFLSHSAKDKGYVSMIAERLGPHFSVYDELTFEEGMKTFEEIERSLDKTDIFVIFISDASLNSDWVKKELQGAHKRLEKDQIDRIFPIIIDQKITYRDDRIPNWMREQYNLKPILRQVLAARRIEQKLKEITWKSNPKFIEREKIFVGRNELMQQLEERMDSIEENAPACFIASGLASIGRRTLLKHFFRKANVTDASYQPAVIYLDQHSSIEDFIRKVYDLGFSGHQDLSNLMTKTLAEKIEIAVELSRDFQRAKEILFIADQNCIINAIGEVNNWFLQLLEQIKNDKTVTFAIASSSRLKYSHTREYTHSYVVEVPELNEAERRGLLKRYAEFHGLELSNQDLQMFLALLQGYPEQIFLTVHIIQDVGLAVARTSTEQIVEFSINKVSTLVGRYNDDEAATDFLHFLSRFEFISFALIFDVVGDSEHHKKLLSEFINSAMCEYLGANREYIRINDAIRNYMSRQKIGLNEHYKKKIREHVQKFLSNYKEEEVDASDFFFSLKAALKEGVPVEEKYLIPSHFLKTIIELYNEKRYKEIIPLAERALANEENLDERMRTSLQFQLCQSLARLKDRRVLEEVQKIHGAEHHFILGFYYRLKGDYVNAIDRLLKATNARHDFFRAQRELVNVYQLVDEQELAFGVAKQLIQKDKSNPFTLQAYFKALLFLEKTPENDKEAQGILNHFTKISGDIAKEMSLNAHASYFSVYKNDKTKALAFVEQAMTEFPGKIYPLITKFEIGKRFKDKVIMKEMVERMEQKADDSFNRHVFINHKAIYLASIGKKEEALKLVAEATRQFPEESRAKVIERIEKIASQQSQ